MKRSDENSPYDWGNIVFLAASPVLAAVGCVWYAWSFGLTWLLAGGFFLFWLMTGIAITAGYHRYYSHRTYECSRALQLFYLVIGAGTLENSVLNWASDHRYHHRFVDQDEDPYNINRGGLYAHILWIFRKDMRPAALRFKNAPDLLKDKLVVWQDRWYLPLAALSAFALPALLGVLDGRFVGHFLFAGLLRVVIVQHETFFINSLAHLYGTRPFDLSNSARDNWLLSFFTYGEGFHNFHHKFQADYRNGIHWYQFDLGKWWIRAWNAVGLAWRLRRTPEPMILKAKLEVQLRSLETKVAFLPEARERWLEAMKALQGLPRPTAQSLASVAFAVDMLKHYKA